LFLSVLREGFGLWILVAADGEVDAVVFVDDDDEFEVEEVVVRAAGLHDLIAAEVGLEEGVGAEAFDESGHGVVDASVLFLSEGVVAPYSLKDYEFFVGIDFGGRGDFEGQDVGDDFVVAFVVNGDDLEFEGVSDGNVDVLDENVVERVRQVVRQHELDGINVLLPLFQGLESVL
jgi:hypothetical protein